MATAPTCSLAIGTTTTPVMPEPYGQSLLTVTVSGRVHVVGRPSTRAELLTRIDSDLAALMDVVDALDETVREQSGACGQWSVKDLMAHLDAWHELFLTWEQQGRAGGQPDMPAPGLSWKQTPELNERIWQRARHDGWDDVRARLHDSHARVRDVVAAYADDDLFAKRRYRWTGSTSVGSYAVSATTSHYDWARTQIRRFLRTLA